MDERAVVCEEAEREHRQLAVLVGVLTYAVVGVLSSSALVGVLSSDAGERAQLRHERDPHDQVAARAADLELQFRHRRRTAKKTSLCSAFSGAAVNVTVSAFAAAAPCCGVAAAGRRAHAAVDQYLLPAWCPAANSPHAAAAIDQWDMQTYRLTDRLTGTGPLHRSCFACYAGSANKHVQRESIENETLDFWL